MNIKGLEERGESYYNPLLNGVIESLEEQGLAVESEGAKVVYLEGVSSVLLVFHHSRALTLRLCAHSFKIIFKS